MTGTRPTGRFERWLPLAGVLGGAVIAVAVLLTISEPMVTDGAAKHARWFADHQAQAVVAAFAALYGCVLILLFASAIRRALRPAGSAYATAAFGGGVALALSIALTGAIFLAQADAAGKHNATALTTLGFLDGDIWLPTAAAMAAFYLATGLGALRAAALPKPWAIVTVVLGALAVVPLGGIASFLATPIWLIVTGILVYRREPALAPAVAAERLPSPA